MEGWGVKNIIPEAALEQHIAVLGKTGSGKTFAAKAAIIEPLLALGRRVGIVDPTDAWWGLRSSRDGKGPGFPVLVLGGDHGDLPLPANGGAAVARLLIEQGINLVACTKHLTVGERTRWFIDFAGTVNRVNRSPLYLVLDEAHNFAPQGKVPDPDTGKMLHAANALASEGRSKGIRLTMITQRPQKLHKDTLTCAETLIAMRVLAPHDRLAVEDWIKGCGDMATGKDVLNSLASLQRGEGWVWYPEGGHLMRTKFPAIRTFDSSATPTHGHAIEAPKKAAEVDLTEIRKALADAVKEAEANDPKMLRAEVARLKAELAKKQPAAADPLAVAAARQEGRKEGARDGYLAGLKALQPIADRIATLSSGIAETVEGYQHDLQRLAKSPPPATPHHINLATSPRPRTPTVVAVPRASGPGESLQKSARLPPGELAVLKAAAQYPEGVERDQLSVLTGYKRSSRDAYIARLREKGFVQINGERIEPTEQGFAALGRDFEPLPTGDALRNFWMGRLPDGERKTLEILVEGYPNAIAREVIDQRTGYKRSSRDAYLGRLRARRLVEFTGRGEVKASEGLFG